MPHLFPKGSYVKNKNKKTSFAFILEELGDLRFISKVWNKPEDGKKMSKQAGRFHTIADLQYGDYVAICTAEEAGVV